jgi:hypothetical protein
MNYQKNIRIYLREEKPVQRLSKNDTALNIKLVRVQEFCVSFVNNDSILRHRLLKTTVIFSWKFVKTNTCNQIEVKCKLFTFFNNHTTNLRLKVRLSIEYFQQLSKWLILNNFKFDIHSIYRCGRRWSRWYDYLNKKSMV